MKIALWGAGEFAKYVVASLSSNNEIDIVCSIDNYKKKESIAGINVVDPEEYLKMYDESVDCVLVTFLNGISIQSQIQEMGIKRWGVVNDNVFLKKMNLEYDLLNDRNIIWNSDREMNLPVMETLETNVVDYCNLNCKGCSHFSNISEQGAQIPYEIFERDIKFLSDKIYIKQFNLLGGEVFLNTRIIDYIECLRQYMPKSYIVVITNGLLIPKLDKSILMGLEANHVEIQITEYFPTTKIKNQIEETLNQYHIRYQLRDSVVTFGKNIDLTGGNDPQKSQTSCRQHTCQFLRDGKIYKCPFSALGNYFFDYYNIPLHFEEGIDIYCKDINWERLSNNLRKMPIELCRYCGLEERFTWEISRNPHKEEWLI